MNNKNWNAVTGRIFDIQRFSIHDGPGIRTTVFLKGCPLNCIWCHNPESISAKPVLSFLPDRCIGCGYCFKVCQAGAHQMVDGKHIIDRTKCTACGECAKECYARAIELVGKTVTCEEVMKDVLADRPFYETSKGGMTLSGGEPLIQPDFSEALLTCARDEGLHCCVDTCGQVSWDVFERMLGLVDLFLYDVKDTNPQRHKENTGVDNILIQENLKKLHDAGGKIWIRIPLIPGCNDSDDNLAGMVKLFKNLPNIEAATIMPYHKLGQSKIDRFGLVTRSVLDAKPPSQQKLNHWINTLRSDGVNILNSEG